MPFFSAADMEWLYEMVTKSLRRKSMNVLNMHKNDTYHDNTQRSEPKKVLSLILWYHYPSIDFTILPISCICYHCATNWRDVTNFNFNVFFLSGRFSLLRLSFFTSRLKTTAGFFLSSNEFPLISIIHWNSINT